MTSSNIHNFLRRTLLAAAATVGLVALSIPAVAQIKTETGGVLCDTYGSISIAPNGGIVVTSCSTSTTPPPNNNPPPATGGDVFAISSYPTAAIPLNGSSLVLVTRSSPTAVAASINYSITGGCAPASGTFWIDTNGNTQGFPVYAPTSGSGTCTITLTSVSVGSVGTPGSVAVGFGTTAPPNNNPPPASGCAAIPQDAVNLSLTFQGADQWLLNSGQVGYAKLTDMSTLGRIAGRIITNDVTATPSSGLVREITISKCPGEINPAAGGANSLLMASGQGTCYWTMSGSGSAFINDFFQAPGANPTSDDTLAKTYHVCEAYSSQGQWYVNVKWTYPASSCGWGRCGLTGQSNFPSINP